LESFGLGDSNGLESFGFGDSSGFSFNSWDLGSEESWEI
jgi:hypothetical protein